MRRENKIVDLDFMKRISFLLFFLLIIQLKLYAEFRLSPVFGDNMVIQRDKVVKIWGWANKNDEVKLHFNGQVVKTKTNKNGEWTVLLKPMPYGGPYSMNIQCGDKILDITDILVGDLWFCSGQSNMVWKVSQSYHAGEETASANYPQIRSFNVGRQVAFEPAPEIKGKWEVCSPETVGNFSAVAYFFARKLYQETNIPIGIINASWGGTEIEPWISGKSFGMLPGELKDHYSYTPETFPDSMKIKLKTAKADPAEIQPNLYPSVLYNGMINPFVKMPIKGVIWYQGENNAHAGRSGDYYALFPCLIQDWREQWGYEFPFYWVQLASYKPENLLPEESSWAELRDAQHQALSLLNTGEAVTIDIGDANDIHPKNKQDVGLRLALIALNKTYGQDIVYSGPVYKSMDITGSKVILNFDYAGSGLIVKNKYGYLQGFAIAGADQRYVWAKAYVNKNNQVVVYSDKVITPVFVRYAWSNNPEDANLFNKEGLPASPFQTSE
ncbi:sialate O-acetylesterase [uncultured Proteiniphilum sp.]|uniref:sialate O-acetylesterase n=1 Tax=uncultured Proteiniphilum sp. TaxID=497637 RepID=UPI0026288116|nr:sialate O-acetylesterase [uncultured Proteiniphilum sp.]